jgi:hypothetical protein
MKTANALAAMGVVVMLPCLGCAKEQTRSPAQPVAAHVAPAAPTMGVTELQAPSDESTDSNDEPILDLTPGAPSEPPAPDAQLGVRPDGTPVTAANIVLRGGKVPMPDDAELMASVSMDEVRAFPEEKYEATVAVEGFGRAYRTKLSYPAAVRFFERRLGTGGFETSVRTVTAQANVWSIRCAGGERAHVAVRKTVPTTIEVVQTSKPVAESP